MAHIDVESVLGLLQVALRVQAVELEAACLKFAVEHVAAVRRHPSYEECRSVDVIRRVATAWANELEYVRDHSHL